MIIEKEPKLEVAGVRTLLDQWTESVRRKDIDRLMSLYASSIVYFDVVPPLKFVGHDQVRENFQRWFSSHANDIEVEIRDLDLSASEGLATAFMLYRAAGTLTAGKVVDYWVRASIACQRFDRGWLIIHEHISVPADMAEGRAITDLKP